jgi:hypothetical protein
VPICVAALSGLTFIAYEHPKEYQKLYPILVGIIFTFMVATAAYNIGAERASSAIYGSIEGETASKASGAISDIEIPWWIASWLPLGIYSYLFFLWTFQFWLLKDK